jgi:hypothetical protein
MMSTPSVHDNNVYAYCVLAETRQIILHTEFTEKPPVEYTDVIFEGVVAHHFECSLQGNILLGIDQVDLKAILAEYAPTIQRLKPYAWPTLDFTDLDDLERKLRKRDIHAFRVDSSIGLTGFICASSIKYNRRAAKAVSNE